MNAPVPANDFRVDEHETEEVDVDRWPVWKTFAFIGATCGSFWVAACAAGLYGARVM